MEKQIDIAVIGATGLVGAAVLEHLADSDIAIAQLYPLASDESRSNTVEYDGRHLRVRPVSEFDFSQVQLCFFCTPGDLSEAYISKAVAANCYCIDFSSATRLQADVPLVVMGVNEHSLQALTGKVVASADSSIVHLSQLLKPFREHVGIERVSVTILRAVSELGRKGIDELSEQSIALFNLKPLHNKHFAEQIAFNVLPHASYQNKAQDLVKNLHAELCKVLQDESILFNAFLIQVPVFYGHSMSIQLELNGQMTIKQVQELLAATAHLQLMDSQANRPNSVTDAVHQDGVYVGCVQSDPSWADGINLWAVADNIHQGAAINGVQIAEILVKDYL